MLRREIGETREHSFMFAVIGQALDDISSTASADYEHRVSAVKFFESGNFVYFAQMAGIDCEYVDRVIKKSGIFDGDARI